MFGQKAWKAGVATDSFLQTDWTRVYSPGAEILSYLRHVSDKYKVTPLVKLRHELVNARFDEASGKWHVRVRRHSESDPSGFEEFDDDADFVFSSMGSLSRWNWPDIEGLKEFKGKLIHSADWNVGDEELATWVNKKVGVVGLVRIILLYFVALLTLGVGFLCGAMRIESGAEGWHLA